MLPAGALLIAYGLRWVGLPTRLLRMMPAQKNDPVYPNWAANRAAGGVGTGAAYDLPGIVAGKTALGCDHSRHDQHT